MRISIKLKRGDDEQRQVSLTTSNKSAVDLTALQRADLHAKLAGTGTKVLELSTENGLIEIADAENGKLLLHFPHHLTENETWQQAEYDLQLTLADGRIKTVLSGQILLLHDITKLGAE